VTASRGIRARRQPADSNNLFDVLASRSELIGECLVYMTQSSDERPKVSYNGYMVRAYVAVYLRVHGEVKHNVLHTCNTPRCWNPMHLYDGTKRDNALDSIADGTHVTYKGEQHVHHRFTDKEIADMRVLFDAGMKIADIARVYDTDRGTVSRIVHMQSRVA
jgi:hypothetical protein